jgi:hypothetical protein
MGMDSRTGEIFTPDEMDERRRRGQLSGNELLLKAAREIDQAERMRAQGKKFVSPRDNKSPLGRMLALSRKRQRYLDRKRREREGNRRAGNVRKRAA